jgi:peptidoglycan/xylan/chitin deacetylase (PgdA/CDA1 family)
MEIVKKFGIPATLAVAGVKASELAGFAKPWQQIASAILGAGFGLFIASKV